jgi:TonB-dependent SusC/RagA subfamily outer membrane receptor
MTSLTLFPPMPADGSSDGARSSSRTIRCGAATTTLLGATLLAMFSATDAHAQGGTQSGSQSSTQSNRQAGAIATRADSTARNAPLGGASISASAAQSRRPATTLADLIAGRFAGLDVLTTGASGTGSRLRIRGQSTFALASDPLVIVDGVRLYGLPTTSNSQQPSRLNDINVEEIEDIELLSGPAATAKYGPSASNGVIRVTTKTGSVGRAQVRAYADGGLITDPRTYPDLWALWSTRTGQSSSSRCQLALISASTCVVDSLSHGNVMNIDSLTPIDRGYRTQAGVQVSGGSRALQYFVSAEREDETGVYRMPDRDQKFLQTERGVSSLPKEQTRPSASDRTSVRANIAVNPIAALRFNVNAAYIDGTTRLVANENNARGLGVLAYGGLWRHDVTGRTGFPLAGYTLSAGDAMSQGNAEDIGRFIGGVSGQFDPLSWLSLRGAYGKDEGTQTRRTYTRRNEGFEIGGLRTGAATRNREQQNQSTLDFAATVRKSLVSDLTSATTLGYQELQTRFERRLKTGSDLPAGSINPDDAAISAGSFGRYAGNVRSLYLTQDFSFDKKLNVSGTLRRDAYDFLGAEDQDALLNGSIGAAWTLSEHGFMKNASAIERLRLRAGYGLQRSMPDAIIAPSVLATFSGIGGSGAQIPVPGAETTRETEVGVDASLFGGATAFELTYFNKASSDVIIPIALMGVGAPSYYSTGADINNRGVELALSQRIVNSKNLAANLTITGSTLRNRLTRLYEGFPPPFWGDRTTMRSTPGSPIFGFWQRTYTYADANNDGILTVNEMTYSDTAQYLGPSFPTRQVSVMPSVELFNHNVRINAQIDSKWGFRKFNNTLRHQCQPQASSCRGVNDRAASLEVQAAALAASGSQSFAGMIEDGAFTRLREVTVAVDLPDAFARATRSSGWTLMLTGRNLGVSTNYTGVDPESSASATDTYSDEFFSTPLPRTFLLRLNVRF